MQHHRGPRRRAEQAHVLRQLPAPSQRRLRPEGVSVRLHQKGSKAPSGLEPLGPIFMVPSPPMFLMHDAPGGANRTA